MLALEGRLSSVLLDTFAELRQATISVVVFVSPSIRLSSRPHGTIWLPLTDFHEI
jgi:hypothetical protein